MKTLTIAILLAFICAPIVGSAQQSTPQPGDIQIELAKENQFVVKIMEVISKSGKKKPELSELDSFRNEEKLFIFKDSKGKLKKIPQEDVKKIAFNRVRQGVLTGKPASLRVNAWSGKIKNFELSYRDVKIKDGYLFLDPNEISKHYKESSSLRANSYEWSDKLNKFWARKQKESPEVFASEFAFEDGYGIISRKMAAEYCKACLKIEILKMQTDPEKETLLISSQDVFYDRYYEK